MTILLQRIGDSGWIPVSVNNIQGNPGATTSAPQRCWVKIGLDYSPIGGDIFFDIVTHIKTAVETRRYLSADEDRITIDGATLGAINGNRVALFQQVITSQNLDIQLDFTDQPGTPNIDITT